MTGHEAVAIIEKEKCCLEKATSGRCEIRCGECRENVPIIYKMQAYDMAIQALEEIQQYRKIGTVEECREAKDKTQPRKPIFKQGKSGVFVDYSDGHGKYKEEKWADWVCPECGWFVGEQYIPRRHNQQKCNFCSRCGQAIDWSEQDERN